MVAPYLISLDDEMFLNNQNNDISSHLFSVDNIINVNEINEVNESIENTVNESVLPNM